MGFADNVSAVQGDVSNHAMNIFIEYFQKFPQHQNIFADYKGKDPVSLKSLAKFKSHTTKVLTKLITILEQAEDGAALNANCDEMAKMPQHNGLNIGHFTDICEVAVAYLQKTLGGSCDASWATRCSAFTTCLKGKI